jgi:hypothetical protein
VAGIAACKRQLQELESKAAQQRRDHLGNQYKLALTLKNPQQCKEIKEIIKREEQRNSWACIKQATGDPRIRATQKVQKFIDREVVDVLEASEMNKEIQQVTEKRFDLAHSAAITRSSLWWLVGYCAATIFAQDLLKGTAAIPADVDDATAALIWEFQHLFQRLKHTHKPIDITPKQLLLLLGTSKQENIICNLGSALWALESNAGSLLLNLGGNRMRKERAVFR